MNTKAVLHKGDLATCVVCNPELKDKQEKRRRKQRTEVTADLYVRRQVAAEIGEDEPTKEERSALLQKYGVTAPRIDRQITRPKWMGVVEWKRMMHDWYKATKGLVTPLPRKPFVRRDANVTTSTHPKTKPWREIRDKKGRPANNHPRNQDRFNPHRDTRTRPRNYGQTNMETRQS